MTLKLLLHITASISIDYIYKHEAEFRRERKRFGIKVYNDSIISRHVSIARN